jgi:hypothetical protein
MPTRPKFQPRKGMPNSEVTRVANLHTPILSPAEWFTRNEVADRLKVDARTVDRYIRNRQLSVWRGPVEGRVYGVRVWALDVIRWGK